MKKNMIFLVIDSVFYDKILSNKYRNTPMPFLTELSQKGLVTEKMYSEAPYTEAALVSLLSGVDTLKNGGYLKKLDNKKTIMEVFKEHGYTTYFNGIQPLVYPSKSYPGVTDKYYNLFFDLETLWSYRLYFYSDLYKSGKLETQFYPLLIDILEDNFITWIECLNLLKNKDKSMEIIEDRLDKSSLNNDLKIIKEEYQFFIKNKEEYMLNFLLLGKDHKLFKLKKYNISRGTSKNFRKKLYEKERNTFKKIYYTNFRKNLFNNSVINHIFNNPKKSLQYLKMYKAAVMDKDLYEKIDYNTETLKASPSMYTYVKHFSEWLKKHDKNKPFFAYIHTEECHSPEIFYSHDTENEQILQEEFESIRKFLKNLPKKYKGNIAYDLALLYTDRYIKYLYEELKQNDLLKNTNIAICADHGSSYSYDPIHDSYVRNEYREKYNIPFILIGEEIPSKIIKKYCNSKDIPATILDACKINIPKEYTGKSLLKYDGNDYSILQNINGGCPDYNLRNVMLGIKNDKFSITMEFDMNKDFKDGKMISIYDIQKDMLETKNLKNKNNIKLRITNEIKILEQEFNELKRDIKKNNFLYSKGR